VVPRFDRFRYIYGAFCDFLGRRTRTFTWRRVPPQWRAGGRTIRESKSGPANDYHPVHPPAIVIAANKKPMTIGEYLMRLSKSGEELIP
jgi:hypothetical protein